VDSGQPQHWMPTSERVQATRSNSVMTERGSHADHPDLRQPQVTPSRSGQV
jgi:hypothetical protein